MQFNSLFYLIFFPLVVLLYFSFKQKYRWIILLIASYYFYISWKAEYIILIIASTLVDYYAGLEIFKSVTKRRKKIFLSLSLIVNLGLLFTFKYFNFFSESVRGFLQSISIPFDSFTLSLLLPIGISFYTFQTLSYIIDIYRGKIKPEKHLGIFAVFVSFFPQLVSGPIERAKNLLPQFYERHSFDYKRVVFGLQLMLWGFFKKIVIADNLALFVNEVYGNVTAFSGIDFVIATIFFGFQIYCDFSGYTDIAIGSAQILGFSLMDNFRRPYSAKNVREFWQRWHISLSTWFRDYFYIPLGGNRVSVPRWYLNLLLVFVVSGLWHGSNWTFIFWGALHGFYMIFSLLTKKIRENLVSVLKLHKTPWLYTFFQISITFILVMFAWIFFRANTLHDAWYIVSHLFSKQLSDITLGRGMYSFIVAVSSILFLGLVHLLQKQQGMRQFLSEKPLWIRWSIYLLIILSILLFGEFGQQEFIYFQF